MTDPESPPLPSSERAHAPAERGAPPEATRERRRALLRHALEHAAHLLPAQAPLEVFVHHNTLHSLQHLPFHEALATAERALGGRCYLPEETCREAFRQGRILPEDLALSIGQHAGPLPEAPPGFPPSSELLALVLRYGIHATSPARLRWTLDEHEADRRFAHDVTEDARAHLLADPTGGTEPDAVRALWEACLEKTRALPAFETSPSAAPRHHREALRALALEDPITLAHPVLIPLCAAFLDRGQAQWTMPDRERGFFFAWSRLLTTGRAVRHAWLASLGRRLRAWIAQGATPEDVTLDVLDALGVDDHDLEPFVEAALLQLPGWAGMFHRLAGSPDLAVRSSLGDFLAVRLVLDQLALEDVCARARVPHTLGPLRALAVRHLRAPTPGPHLHAWPLFLLAQHAGVGATRLGALSRDDVRSLCALLHRADARTRAVLWHEAFEARYRDTLLHALALHRRAPSPPPAPTPVAQVITCIDDRCESLRRHLEERSPRTETLGAAGFFNLAIAYQGIDDPSTFPLCPVVVQPRHYIGEKPVSGQTLVAATRVRRLRRWGVLQAAFARASRSLVFGPILTGLSGFVVTVPLLLQVFAPRLAAALRRGASSRLLPTPETRLSAAREVVERESAAALVEGFTVEEKTDRVASLLENLGLIQHFAPLVAVLGHDSSSVNNPHFAAYSCGACGGRSGGPNARLFARMANRPEVREGLKARGVHVPDETVFVGGVHDTAADTVRFFDVEDLPARHRPALEALQRDLDEALRHDAHERCRRFASAPRELTPEAALEHVRERAVDLSQARPELGHATNAACVVGRRALTRGLFLDRRAFLVSYDPALDPEGRVLERLLLAVGPVGAGINLEYYFSAVDPERLGAGTKLPHNVTGLIGVMNGAQSDLRTGLPRQMTEVHEPVRLQLVVESTPSIMESILERAAPVAELVRGEWVRLSVIHRDTGEVSVWDARRGFTPWTPSEEPLPTVPRSSAWYGGREGPVPPARIVQEGPRAEGGGAS